MKSTHITRSILLAILVIFGTSAYGMAGYASPGPAAGDAIIVEMGYGISRCGLQSQNSPQEFAFTVRHDHINFKGDFRNLMNQVYTKLNITDKTSHPILIVEPDQLNSWRRVDMADVLMGENKHPWMYAMWTSMVVAYNNDPGTGTVLSYHAEEGYSSIVAVIGGWPYSLGYGVEFDYHEPQLVRAADSVFWTTVRCPYADRGDLLNNIVLSGNNWKGISASDIAAFEERINIQRLLIAHDPRVIDSEPRDQIVFRGGKKLFNDGILIDWDLAFTQNHYTQNGAEYIRQWVF